MFAVSSSGLIYAVIVGAWAAYLVPMWLRRQDELNEARPTERFSTAIRLLSGRAGLERRYAKALDEEHGSGDEAENALPEEPDATASADHAEAPVDVRALAVPATEPGRRRTAQEQPPAARPAAPSHQNARARVLARRRRTTTVLFLAFTAGAIIAAVGGLAFLWAPLAPGALLTSYIVYLRGQERRRFEFTMDQRRAVEAARTLREARTVRQPRPPLAAPSPADRPRAHPHPHPRPKGRAETAAVAEGTEEPAPAAPAPTPRETAERRALVEETDHAEWVDQQRERTEDGWEPVPVPLPTYVTAPVAPRTHDGVDLSAPDAWSSARSAPAEPAEAAPEAPVQAVSHPLHGPDRSRTPLFDQYADEDRPRAANE
ncbi:hypothetical protein GCM10010406_44160 [Streptomyces thermolineatus]|uniref:Integral membrane protein n=1 Tax=Streptomyces thermolineatus TaxID=44033 RepID=A0ABN3MIM5_9ACTN